MSPWIVYIYLTFIKKVPKVSIYMHSVYIHYGMGKWVR